MHDKQIMKRDVAYVPPQVVFSYWTLLHKVIKYINATEKSSPK